MSFNQCLGCCAEKGLLGEQRQKPGGQLSAVTQTRVYGSSTGGNRRGSGSGYVVRTEPSGARGDSSFTGQQPWKGRWGRCGAHQCHISVSLSTQLPGRPRAAPCHQGATDPGGPPGPLRVLSGESPSQHPGRKAVAEGGTRAQPEQSLSPLSLSCLPRPDSPKRRS